MTASPPPQKPRLKDDTKRLILRRRLWRRRALDAALELATWPPGKPDREKCEAEMHKTINKLRQWFRDPRASLVIQAVQRRAVAAFRSRS